MNDESRPEDARERNRATLRAILASRDNVVKRYGYEVVRAVPHDRSAFTQGLIWANIWPTNFIARIGPETGAVLGVVDLSNILPKADQDETTNVLNGTAHDPSTGGTPGYSGHVDPKAHTSSTGLPVLRRAAQGAAASRSLELR